MGKVDTTRRGFAALMAAFGASVARGEPRPRRKPSTMSR